MTRFLDKYIIYYLDKWEIHHRLSFALTGLTIYAIQLLYYFWALCMIPVVIWMAATLYHQNIYITSQDKYIASQHNQMKQQNNRIIELQATQLLAFKYEKAVKSYYDEVLKSRGFKSIRLQSKKIGPNSFELIMPTKIGETTPE